MDTGVTVVHDTVLNTQKLLREYLLNVFTKKRNAYCVPWMGVLAKVTVTVILQQRSISKQHMVQHIAQCQLYLFKAGKIHT